MGIWKGFIELRLFFYKGCDVVIGSACLEVNKTRQCNCGGFRDENNYIVCEGIVRGCFIIVQLGSVYIKLILYFL